MCLRVCTFVCVCKLSGTFVIVCVMCPIRLRPTAERLDPSPPGDKAPPNLDVLPQVDRLWCSDCRSAHNRTGPAVDWCAHVETCGVPVWGNRRSHCHHTFRMALRTTTWGRHDCRVETAILCDRIAFKGPPVCSTSCDPSSTFDIGTK